ncbi:MAG: ATP-dependent DNA helicase RecG [Acutalibacteraceae bacterium]
MASAEKESVRYLSGVGERRAALFEKLGVVTLRDLLRHFPRAYEDWSNPVPLSQATAGEDCCVRATVTSMVNEYRVRKGMTLYRFSVSDGYRRAQITLFNNPYAAAKIRKGDEILLYGQVKGDFHRLEMTAPQIETLSSARIRPIYPQTEGLTSRVIEKTVAQALQYTDGWLDADPLPPGLRQELQLCTRRFAMENIHFPTDHETLAMARRRMVFEELFLLQLGMLQMKGRARQATGARITADHTAEYESLLPFTLTGAQKRAIADCVADIGRDYPMSRLIQGDVGSGKTAVAAGVAFTVIRAGFQAALMAPTGILAEQHAASLQKLLSPGGIRVELLTGGMPVAKRRALLEDLRAGKIDLLVGTHALLSEGVDFARLGLVITDEQHRFGVGQRSRLAQKGESPHLMVMSATPIPRTLALMIYGDLDVSILDELPPGRQPIATYAVDSGKRERAYGYVRKHLDEGRQGYVVCPLVEEGETDLASAEAYADQLAAGAFAGYRLGLLHGRMKTADKEKTMTAFAAGEIDLLVSTTVVEVGVDVPNAVIMVIENAERFGLAQLHQLRGRVGRGKHASTCILISDAQNEEARRRLKVMCETTDGFRIADEDLKLRGPGDFFGSRQHGLPDLKIADLQADMVWLRQAGDAARRLHESDPQLEDPQNRLLKEEIDLLYGQVGEQGLN